MLECARISKSTLAFCGPTDAVSSLGILFAFSFRFSVARRSFCKSVIVSISRFEMRIFDFLLEMSLGHALPSAIVTFVAVCRLLSVDLQHMFRLFRLFNLHLSLTLQYVVSGSVSDC